MALRKTSTRFGRFLTFGNGRQYRPGFKLKATTHSPAWSRRIARRPDIDLGKFGKPGIEPHGKTFGTP